MRRPTFIVLMAVLLAATAGALAVGQDLPKLPGEIAVRQSPDSPGKVTFLHASHMGDKPDCTQCHPKLFSIMKPAGTKGAERITHANMEKGRQCGACHNGKKTFAFDDCSMCHK